MGQRRDAAIESFQHHVGIRPASGARADILEKMSQLAFELIKAIELERSGIRDGDGSWSGCDVIGSIVHDLAAAERADLDRWKAERDNKGVPAVQ